MKRCLLTILIVLLLGAVLNVAVAWTCAAFPKWRNDARSGPLPRAEARLLIRQYHEWVSELPTHEQAGAWRYEGDEIQCLGLRTAWASVVTNRAIAHVRIEESGWPFRANSGYVLRVREVGANGTHIERHGLWLIESLSQGFGRYIPVIPIWPGFAANTVLYAAILWLAIRGPFVLRHHFRPRRGRCPKCGYDLRGELPVGCPECGWNRDAAEA